MGKLWHMERQIRTLKNLAMRDETDEEIDMSLGLGKVRLKKDQRPKLTPTKRLKAAAG